MYYFFNRALWPISKHNAISVLRVFSTMWHLKLLLWWKSETPPLPLLTLMLITKDRRSNCTSRRSKADGCRVQGRNILSYDEGKQAGVKVPELCSFKECSKCWTLTLEMP